MTAAELAANPRTILAILIDSPSFVGASRRPVEHSGRPVASPRTRAERRRWWTGLDGPPARGADYVVPPLSRPIEAVRLLDVRRSAGSQTIAMGSDVPVV